MIQTIIKWLGRPIVSSVAFFTGYCFLAESLGVSRGARILSYHGINDRPANPYAVSTHNFAEQMRFLVERFTIISVDQLVDLLEGGRPIPPRAVAVTIDDGYRDTYTNAYPILRRFAIPATFFLPVEFIGVSSSDSATSKLPQTDFLSWDQVRAMSQDGIAFGSHTLSHVPLTRVTCQEAECQLQESKARLEVEIGKPVTGFAYPYGTVRDFDPAIERLVAAAGYSWAVTGLSGVNNHRSNPFALRRTKVERYDGMYVFKKAARGALDPWIVMDKLGKFL